MALFGVYYHLVRNAGEHVLAKARFVVATAGVLSIVTGIVMAMEGMGGLLAKIGSDSHLHAAFCRQCLS